MIAHATSYSEDGKGCLGERMPAKRPLKDRSQDQDKKFRLLFEDNPQPMWVLDPQTRRFLEANAASSALYGYSQDEFRSMTLSDVQSGEESLDFPEELTSPISTTPSAWRHRTKSGRMIDVEIAGYEITR